MRSIRIAGSLAAVVLLGTAVAQAGWDEGLAAFKANDLNRAATEFGQLVESQPDWPGGHYMLGWTRLKQDRHQEAISHLRKAYELDPGQVGYQLRLGEAYVAAGRYSDAGAFLSKIDESSLPAELRSFLAQLKAVAFTKTGQTDRAVSEFGKAAKANPNDARAQYQYGTAAYNAGDTATAISALSKSVRLDPGDLDKQSAYAKALNRLGRESRGEAKLDAYRKAAQAAQKVVAADASYENLMLLGETELGAKLYDNAITSFQKASAKNGSDWLSPYYIGQAYTAKQQYRSAETALKLSLDKTNRASDQVKIWRQLAFVYEKQKNYDEAISAYKRAGDSASAQRVQENREISSYNQEVDQEAEQIRKLQEEQEKIRQELQDLPGGPPPSR